MAFEAPIKQWGLLSWNERYAYLEGSEFRICKTPGGAPILIYNVMESNCMPDPSNPCRVSL
eukprot:SAG22_NODE_16933_length_314_cov_1.172093_1_plen_60_part_01